MWRHWCVPYTVLQWFQTDFYLFFRLKSALKARRLYDATDTMNATEELKRLSQNGLQESFTQHLYSRWQIRRVVSGEYFEGTVPYMIILICTGLFKMTVGVQLSSGNSAPHTGNDHHLTIPFEVGMYSFKRQGACVSRNWRYESEPPLMPSPLTCGTNSIIVLMFVESQRVHV